MSRPDNAVKQLFKIFLPLRNSFDFTLPYPDYSPSKGFQFSFVADISGNVAFNLFFPKFDIGFWQTEILAVLMTMPKSSVDENDGLVFRQNNIRLPWEFFDLNTKPQTTREKILPHNHLRLCILPLDCCHTAAPLLGGQHISHLRQDNEVNLFPFVVHGKTHSL